MNEGPIMQIVAMIVSVNIVFNSNGLFERLFDVLNLFTHLFDQYFQGHRHFGYRNINRFGADGIGFTVEFLHQKIAVCRRRRLCSGHAQPRRDGFAGGKVLHQYRSLTQKR